MDGSVTTTTTTAAVVGQTARSAQNVSEDLIQYLLRTKSRQDAVRSLQCEVKSFGDACDALHSLLNGLAGSSARMEEAWDEQFYIKLQQSMSEYATTVTELGQQLRIATNTKSSFLRPAKSSIDGEQLVRARQRIDSHLQSVQVLLGTFNLRLALQSLDTIELSTLRNRIQDLQRKRLKLQTTSRVNSPHLGQDQQLFARSSDLISEADSILTTATSIYEESLSSRWATRGSRVSVLTEAVSTNSPILPSPASQPLTGNEIPSVYQESIASTSVISLPVIQRKPVAVSSTSPPAKDVENEPLSASSHPSLASFATNTNNVSQWIHGLSELDKRQRASTLLSKGSRPSIVNRSSSTVASEILSNQSIGERLASDVTSLTEPSTSPLSQSTGEFTKSEIERQDKSASAVMDDSDEDDIGLELAKNVLTMGESALDKEDYARARGCLIEGLNLVQQLPSKVQANACDMLELRYQLATCALALDSQAVVETSLVEVLQQEPTSDAQREKLFHISHILAQLYVRTARLSLARQTCNNALRGRRKLCGKDSEGYYASLALMSRICELESTPVQAQGYMSMIPVDERQNHSFRHLRTEEYSQKEVVGFAEDEATLRPARPTAPQSSPSVNTPSTGFEIFVPPTPAIGVHPPKNSQRDPLVNASSSTLTADKYTVDHDQTSVTVAQPPRNQVSVASPSTQPPVRSGDSVKSVHSSRTSNTEHGTPANPLAPSAALARSYLDIPSPTPKNDYLGFCRGAWLVQNRDPKAMKKSKDFDYGRSSNQLYSLTCSASKCYFGTEIELSLIGTWSKVWKVKERMGIAYRWAFLAKSHVRQPNKAGPHQTVYKCMFCTALGLSSPLLQGEDLYFDHVAQEHRGRDLSPVVLYKTCCIHDRVAQEKDEFDINLYPYV